MLGGELGHAVRGDGAWQGRLFGWEHLSIAVHRRAACEHQALDRASFQALEETLGGDDVVAHVLVELAPPAGAYSRLTGEVVHDARAV